MKKYCFYLLLAMFSTGFISCSEDHLTIDEQLGDTMFNRTDMTPALQAANDSLYEKYGSRVFYDFERGEFQLDWGTTYSPYSYVAVPEGNENAILKMIRFIRDEVFVEYPDNLVKRYLPSRLFLVDSVFNRSTYNEYLELKVHAVAISSVGPRLADYTTAKWNDLQNNLINSMLSNIYNANVDALAEFMSEKDASQYTYTYYLYTPRTGYNFPGDATTPYNFGASNETKLKYNLYMAGYSNWAPTTSATFLRLGMSVRPTDMQDLGSFLQFLFKTPKTMLDYVLKELDDFPRLRRRTYLLAQFVTEVLGMDPVAMQNNNCPDDPVPAGYFESIAE